jgi:hypothetical protein
MAGRVEAVAAGTPPACFSSQARTTVAEHVVEGSESRSFNNLIRNLGQVTRFPQDTQLELLVIHNIKVKAD